MHGDGLRTLHPAVVLQVVCQNLSATIGNSVETQIKEQDAVQRHVHVVITKGVCPVVLVAVRVMVLRTAPSGSDRAHGCTLQGSQACAYLENIDDSSHRFVCELIVRQVEVKHTVADPNRVRHVCTNMHNTSVTACTRHQASTANTHSRTLCLPSCTVAGPCGAVWGS